MGRPLWRELRRRGRDPAAPSFVQLRLGRALLAAAVAAVAFGIGRSFGDIHSKHAAPELYALACTVALVVAGLYAVRRLANQLSALLAAQGGREAASAMRLIVTLVGAIIVALLAFGMLRIDVSQLLLGGAITGVVLGIAAQQSLGNLFAGIVLLVARPFVVGSRIRVRSGSLGGPFEGEVMSMGLTYVIFETDEGTILVPNLTLLAAGIVRLPPAAKQAAGGLVVSRHAIKRPPRHPIASHPAGRAPRPVRKPRQIIKSMRERRVPDPPSAVPPSAVPPSAVPPSAVPPSAVPPSAVPPDATPPSDATPPDAEP